MRLTPLFALGVLLLAGTASAGDGQYVVEPGDTLSEIASRHDVSVAQLRAWNTLEGDVIRIGEELHISQPGQEYRVVKGDTVSRIAARAGVSVDDIVALNPGLKPNRVRIGQTLLVPKPAEPPPPVKVPLPCPGRVVQIATHEAYRLRNEEYAWATAYSADALRRGFSMVRIRHRNAPRVRVLDASRREGGRLGGHRSHRDGRDVDITYYQTRCGRSGCPIETVKPSKLDVARQWTLLQYWLDNDDVEYLFIDWPLQKVLYEHAKKKGVSADKLKEWFQYPEPPSVRQGIIRHWSGHQNHVHVRFVEASCKNSCCENGPRMASASRARKQKQR